MRLRLFLCISFLAWFALNSYAQDNLELVRLKFHAVQDEQDLQEVINLSSKAEAQTAEGNILQAYHAASIARQANYTMFPHKKIQYFNKGKNLLESTIEDIPNLESVYLRLVLQLKTPKLLNYYQDINNDVQFVVENLASSNLTLVSKRLIKATLLNSTDDLDLIRSFNNIKFY